MEVIHKKKTDPLVSIVTINYNDPLVTCELLESLKITGYSNYEVIVVDNASHLVAPQIIHDKFPDVKLVFSSTNLGFAGGNNLGVKYAKGMYIFFLNNDTVVMPLTIRILMERLKSDKNLGAVSPKIKYYDRPNVIQYAGSTLINPLTIRNRHIGNHQVDNGQYDIELATGYAHGAAMMVTRNMIKKVGPMSEKYFLYYEELDWCDRIREFGYEIRYIPSAVVYHKESLSVGKESTLKFYYQTRNRFLYARRNIHGWKFLVSMAYMTIISIPKNIISCIGDWKRMKAYCSGIIWNLSNGKLNLKPF
ncbi:MAG: glycosyltransferase family 2 protein [Flavobacteriales bacterium]|nr:glycosyltransferase family 2 protein [Flavobacteriales bacterium]